MHTIVWIPMVFAAIAAALVVAALSRRENAGDEAWPAIVTEQLRSQALFARPEAIGIPAVAGAAWAVVMDSAYDGGCISLVSLIDGSTSIYFSSGGGIIGAGSHRAVAECSRTFVRVADAAAEQFSAAASTEHPSAGCTRFFARRNAALLSADARETELGAGGHPLSPLFYAAQDVIAAIRDHERDVRSTGASARRPSALNR